MWGGRTGSWGSRGDVGRRAGAPGGCSGGGGQPIHEGEELAEERASVLYQLDRKAPMRFSHENPAVQALYREFLEKPLSPLAEQLLHTDHTSWQMPNEKRSCADR